MYILYSTLWAWQVRYLHLHLFPLDRLLGRTSPGYSIFVFLTRTGLIAGLAVIETNKASHPETRFQSIHGKMGLVAYILIFIQWLIGFAQFYTPKVFGGVDNAKALYKYHR
jgi:hypothetical protein